MSITNRALSEADSTTIHYQAGFIVLSYFISLVGCTSALELLHRRTSTRGAFNWYLLIASSIAMGGIGIWSMHFVGNRAIILANGAANRQLLYNQGWTALSFFLPIVVLLIAFHLLAIRGKATRINILLSGLLTGTAVCAMHYVGQVGIANYDCSYKIANIVGAAIIAVVASLIALSVFFRLRDTWTDSWWKRILCAAVLAGAVSGMHWTAAVGTVYRLREDKMSRGSRTRVQTVIFCAVLSLASCVVLLAIAFIRRRRSIRHRKRAQELVLACVYFDEDDRVMVSHDGFLPYQKITNQFVRKTFGEDELSRSHPAFMWVYEASRNWSALQGLVSGMQDQLESDPVARRYQPGYEDSIDLSRSASADFDVIFKQLFCVAAQRLATQIHEPMENLGVMFEEPLETGTIKADKAVENPVMVLNNIDIEKNRVPKVFGKGRYFFLNRRLTKGEAADFAALGYRFGSILHVAESLARNMQVSPELVLSRLDRMKICISREHLPPAGIHLAAFLLRPNVHAGFDILVPTACQNQLPSVTLPITEITPSHLRLLQSVDEWTVRDILKELVNEQSGIVSQEKDFRWQLYSAFVRLVDLIKDSETMMEARFSARPVNTPSRSPEGLNTSSTCIMLSVRWLGSIHHSFAQESLVYVPFDFFGAQQLVETSEARHDLFKRKAQQEFSNHVDESGTLRSDQGKSLSTQGSQRTRKQTTTAKALRWVHRRVSAKMGISEPRPSRHGSQAAVLPSAVASIRSTTEHEAKNAPSTTKVDLNVSTEETRTVYLPEILPATTGDGQTGPSRKHSDEIERVTLTDVRGTFVSELFALFRLSDVSEKGEVPKTEQY